MDRWYWGRAHIGDYTLIFVEQIATKAYGSQRLPVFMLAKGDKILIGDGHLLPRFIDSVCLCGIISRLKYPAR